MCCSTTRRPSSSNAMPTVPACTVGMMSFGSFRYRRRIPSHRRRSPPRRSDGGVLGFIEVVGRAVAEAFLRPVGDLHAVEGVHHDFSSVEDAGAALHGRRPAATAEHASAVRPSISCVPASSLAYCERDMRSACAAVVRDSPICVCQARRSAGVMRSSHQQGQHRLPCNYCSPVSGLY